MKIREHTVFAVSLTIHEAARVAAILSETAGGLCTGPGGRSHHLWRWADLAARGMGDLSRACTREELSALRSAVVQYLASGKREPIDAVDFDIVGALMYSPD